MTNSSTNEMVLVYDIRRDKFNRERLSSGFPRRWRALESGKKRTKISEGLITKLFFAPYEGDHFFELDDGKRRRSWVRFGDESWYAVGRRVRVEFAEFRVFISLRFDVIQVVTKIWIGDDAA
jgi:hypothetical protein